MSILFDGVVSSKFSGTPSNVKGLNPVAWYDMANTNSISTTGNLVDQINDLSGNDNHITQTGADRPSSGTRNVNGHNVVDFDGTTHIQRSTFTGGAESQPNTIFCVGGFDVVDSSFRFMVSGGSVTTRNAILVGNTNDFDIFAGTELKNTAADTHTHVHKAVFDTTSSKHFIDGFSIASGDAGSENLNGITLGADHAGSGNMDGFVAEVVVFDRILTDEESIIVEDYLNKKWFEQVETLVMIGQSNADGAALVSNIGATLTSFYGTQQTDLNIYFKPATRTGNNVDGTDYTDDGEWYNLGINYSAGNKVTHQTIGNGDTTVQNDVNHGIELQYGYRFAQEKPSTELRIFKAAVGGSAIEDDWGITNADTNKLWYWFKTYVWQSGVEDMIATGKRPNVKGVFWMQGEADTANSTLANAYQGRLEKLVSRVNLELGVKTPRIVIGGLTDFYDTANGTIVKTAQATVAANTANAILLPTDGTGDFVEYDRRPDLIHISSLGFDTMGDNLYSLIYGENI